MANNMVPYAIIIGEKYTYFIAHHYQFIENDKIEEIIFLNATNNSLYPYDSHLNKCGKEVFKTIGVDRIHTFWPGVGEDIENDDNISEAEDEDEEGGDLIE